MIRVERDQIDDKGQPIRPSEIWLQKAVAATAKAIAEGAEHRITDLYRDDEVRKALEKLFHRKCAYCESRLGVTSSEEVEHYRPKGAVAECPDHPGYYWLAYTWTNLYPACTYCNQKRRDRPIWDEPGTGPAAGKATFFPLAEETERAMTPEDDLEGERPILLDPCSLVVDPEVHFRYDPRGDIHPRSPEDLQAKATIRLCHLGRRRLRDARAREIQKTSKLLGILERLRSRRGPADREILELQLILDEQTDAGATHAGASRYVVRDPGAF